jgi:hypothetical protein
LAINIYPDAAIGKGILLGHATNIVISETAVVHAAAPVLLLGYLVTSWQLMRSSPQPHSHLEQSCRSEYLNRTVILL